MIVAMIQARMSSTRLPGKVLRPMAGKPMIQWVIEAAQGAETVDDVVVVTSAERSDQELFRFAGQYANVFAGDLDDVLDRYYRAALYYRASHIVRLTGDCPLMKPGLIDETVRHHLSHHLDYTANFTNDANDERVHGTDGLDVEAFTMNALTAAAKCSVAGHFREHVTVGMRIDERLSKGKYLDWPMSNTKLSVDTEEDFQRVREILWAMNARNTCYGVRSK